MVFKEFGIADRLIGCRVETVPGSGRFFLVETPLSPRELKARGNVKNNRRSPVQRKTAGGDLPLVRYNVRRVVDSTIYKKGSVARCVVGGRIVLINKLMPLSHYNVIKCYQ